MTDESQPQVPVAQPTRRGFVTVHSETALFDTAKFEQIARVAQAAYRGTFLPDHLRTREVGNTKEELEPEEVQANCFIVASLAHDFGVGFMAMAQSVSLVHGKPMFEGKLIAAVIEARLSVKLKKTYTGEPGTDSYGIKIWTDQDEAQGYEPIEGTVGEWATKERSGHRKSIWVGANKQKNQLFYMGARVWARLNEPGMMLGIYGADEFNDSDVIEQAPAPVQQRITAGFATTAAPAPEKTTTITGAANADDFRKKAPVDDSSRGSSELVQEGPKAEETKPAPVDQKKGVTPNLGRALHEAWDTLRDLEAQIVGQLADDAGYSVPFNIDGQVLDDETAQAQLGEVNRHIDRVRRILAERPAQSPPPPPPPPAPREPTPDEVLKSARDAWSHIDNWAKLKESFNGFARLSDWRGLKPADKNRVYALIWELASAINAKALERGEPMQVLPDQDATAYRCAIEGCNDAQVVRHMWEAITDSASWKAQSEATRKAVTAATMARLELLEG